jgi:hypothetical protein
MQAANLVVSGYAQRSKTPIYSALQRRVCETRRDAIKLEYVPKKRDQNITNASGFQNPSLHITRISSLACCDKVRIPSIGERLMHGFPKISSLHITNFPITVDDLSHLKQELRSFQPEV